MSTGISFDIQRWTTALTDGLLAPLSYPLDPSRRLFWLFLLSSLLLALWVLRRQGWSWQQVRAAVLRRDYWCSSSTGTDVAYLVLNSLLRALLLIPVLGSHLLVAMAVAHGLQAQLGNAPAIGLPVWSIAVIYTLVFFVVEDLSRFALHVTMHRVPLLWRFHRVHHSATQLTPLTLHRVHPIEMSIYYCRGLLVFGVVSGVFVYLFGRQLSGLAILGVDLLGFLFNLAGANLRHSHIWLDFGRFERWFISPAQHQLHHSSAPQHRDINFGTCLALWDRLAKSWLAAGQRRQLRFGLYAGGVMPASNSHDVASGVS